MTQGKANAITLLNEIITMDRRYYLALTVACAALVGCNREAPSSTADTGSSTNAMQQQVQQTIQSAKDLLADQKQAFVTASQTKIKDLDAKIKTLWDQAVKATPKIREQADPALSKLKQERTALQQKLDELKNSSEQGWQKTTDAFTAGWQDLEKAYQDAKTKLQQ